MLLSLSQLAMVIVNIPLWIFTSAKLFHPTVNSTLQFSMVSLMNIITPLDILYMGPYCVPFSCQSNTIDTFFVSFCSPWGCVDQCLVDLLFLLFPCGILSVLQRTANGLLANSKSPHLSSCIRVLLTWFTIYLLVYF